ncbi:MAG: cyclophilin-like fold protein [Anaerotruncus massiliensis (ex Togo et al. 2019)]
MLDTKDAFWHARNVTVKDSVVKGEYLAWYSDGLTLINCKIIGTQPLCYCKNLKLVDCEMTGTDLAFEKSDVDATITTPVASIKNPRSGRILAPAVGEIILDDEAAGHRTNGRLGGRACRARPCLNMEPARRGNAGPGKGRPIEANFYDFGPAVALNLAACGGTRAPEGLSDQPSHAVAPAASTGADLPEEDAAAPAAEPDGRALRVTVGGQTFLARLYDSGAARALAERLPLTLEMSEMNGNEKYCYLDDGLPTDSRVPSQIRAGDLMLYGADCLVLFYESFSTTYRYTPLGRVEDAPGLADALGSGGVAVSFALESAAGPAGKGSLPTKRRKRCG